MSANYNFIVRLARQHCPAPALLLDFGCGAGEAVLAQRIHDAHLYDGRSDGRVYPWRICA
jgi:hypothetical protein